MPRAERIVELQGEPLTTTAPSAARANRQLLLVVLGLTVANTLAVELLVGGLVSGSLALLADAGHMLTDVVGIGLALGPWIADRPPSGDRTFGYLRLE